MILSGGVQMSVEKRRRYDREFKLEAVRLSGEPGRSVAGVARDLGISENVLHVWQAVGHLSGLYQYGTHRKLWATKAAIPSRREDGTSSGLVPYQTHNPSYLLPPPNPVILGTPVVTK
jgi:hypothetical protein